MNDHDVIIELIPEYAQGRLTHEDSERVSAHLTGCSECRDLLDDCKAMAADLDDALSAELQNHPTSADLSKLVFSPGDLSLDARQLLAFHLAVCKDCAGDLEHVRALAQEATFEERPVAQRMLIGSNPGFIKRLRGAFSRPLVAFSVVAVALLLLAIPLLNQRFGDVSTTSVGTVGSGAELTVALAEQTRSGLSRRTVTISREHQSVKFEMRFTHEGDRSYSVAVVSDAGKTISQELVEPEEAQKGLAQVRLATKDLPDGDYTAIVSSVSAQGDPLSVYYPFTINR